MGREDPIELYFYIYILFIEIYYKYIMIKFCWGDRKKLITFFTFFIIDELFDPLFKDGRLSYLRDNSVIILERSY